ncbi:ATP-grasp superfamily enzyme [Thermoplasmatales archaeon SW_10_69_26]|jgi:uncharacterized protein|nr:MAG: ATP-grasp superfamily enzyme [Thermoplasmatales archaeon SW_10_69_26]
MPETCSFERTHEMDGQNPTLIEGLPGMGLVASIAADQVRRNLDLAQIGHLRSGGFPPMASFEDGLVEETMRVYGGTEPAVLTLHSSAPVPEEAVGSLADCVLKDLAHEFQQAIFLVGAPAQSEDQLGQVRGIGTNPGQRERLTEAGIDLAEHTGTIGGVTGALLQACYRAQVPAVALVTRCRPKIPDPGAARSVIENGLEPLVDFDLDTSDLEERDEEIQRRLDEVARQYQQSQTTTPAGAAEEAPASLYH